MRMFRALPAGLFAILMALSPGSAAHGNDDIRDLPFVLDAVNDALETARTNVQIPWENPATGRGPLRRRWGSKTPLMKSCSARLSATS